MPSKPTVVWTEIPVSDLDTGVAFYEAVFGLKTQRQEGGPNPFANFSDAGDIVSGHIYPGTPARGEGGPTIHLALPDTVEAGMERCRAAGGTVLGAPIAIPPGRFAYATDPDGNSIGLFEPA